MFSISTDVMPQRVRAALSSIYHCRGITDPADRNTGRQLSAAEFRVNQFALDVLAQYFIGEMDYGDHAPRSAVSAVDASATS